MSREALEAQVRAVNSVRSYANWLQPLLIERFRPLVGQKILKADGSLLAKHEKLAPNPLPTEIHQVYRGVSPYSLRWIAKACEPYPPHFCCYEEAGVFIGELSEGVLATLAVPVVYRCDYTVGEVLELREALKAASKAKDDALSALYPFGKYDPPQLDDRPDMARRRDVERR